jgi:hypothetical protein
MNAFGTVSTGATVFLLGHRRTAGRALIRIARRA